jgi:cell division protein FtsW
VLLLVLGLVMQGSISPVLPRGDSPDAYMHLKKHFQMVALGCAGGLIAAMVPYGAWRRFVWVFYGIGVALLVMCYMPVVGEEVNGAKRWVRLGVLFQPSEMMKLIVVMALAVWCEKYIAYQKTLTTGFLYPSLIIGLPVLLIIGEVDIGNSAILGLGAVSVLFLAGTRLRYLVISVAAAAALGAAVIKFVPAAQERIGRLTAVVDLEKHKKSDGAQQWQALRALGSGGLLGVGLGASVEKRTLTFSNSDFIYPIIGEEMGMVAAIGVLLCYLSLCVGAVILSLHAHDPFGKLMAFGIAAVISGQAMVHIGVCVGVLPNKGTALPFVSAGGTSLVVLISAVGLLISIYRRAGSLREGHAAEFHPSGQLGGNFC